MALFLFPFLHNYMDLTLCSLAFYIIFNNFPCLAYTYFPYSSYDRAISASIHFGNNSVFVKGNTFIFLFLYEFFHHNRKIFHIVLRRDS
jgi:hypothetical protein